MIRTYLSLFRPEQWIKNIFVFAGFLFSGKWNEAEFLMKGGAAFIIFCLASSSVYAFNDIWDAEKDRQNPLKQKRPVASGLIAKKNAGCCSFVLAFLSMSLSFLLSPELFCIISGYLLLNLLYTLKVKHLVLLDVFCIALGFMLRVFAGTEGIGIPPSEWIIICTLMLSLFLGFSKRYAELSASSLEGRDVLKDYSKSFLELLLGVTASCAIMAYGLYTISERTVTTHGTDHLIYSLPIVIYGLFRYLYLVVYRNAGGDPSREILADSCIRGTIIVYIAAVLLIII